MSKWKLGRIFHQNVIVCSSVFFLAALSNSGCSSTGAPTQTPTTQPPPVSTIFRRPVISRAYEGTSWTTANETADSYAAALAGVKPSYVSGLIYVNNGQSVTAQMISDYNTIRSAVLALNPNAKFDVEVSLNPNPPSPNTPYANAAAVVAKMTTLGG